MVEKSIKKMKKTKNDKGIQVRRKLKAIGYGLLYFGRHYARYVRNCNCDYYRDEDSFLSVMISNYHTIEKSLTMPDFEPGHGKERVLVVCGDLVKYRELGFNTQNIQYISALQAIDEYRRVHEAVGVSLGAELEQAIAEALKGQVFDTYNQPTITTADFFPEIDFSTFAYSRHSVRAFSDKVIPLSVIEECVNIARTTPTACNRQPNKTYVVSDKKMIERVAQWQGGGRGFVEKANKVFIVTSSVHVFGETEVCEAFKAGGMYTMNLLYALHSKKIGACTLEWNERIVENNKLRKLIGIPDEEEIIMLIAAGYPKDNFRYVTSKRNELDRSFVIVNKSL